MSLFRRFPMWTGVAAVLLCLGSLCPAYSLTPGKIVDVVVSPDLKRVTIRAEGPMGAFTTITDSNPSRLVLDFPGMGVARPQGVTSKESGPLAVRAVKTQSGARVTLDFGASAIPIHRTRLIGNYLMVLLQDWTPSVASNQAPRPERPVPRGDFGAPAMRGGRVEVVSTSGDLSIKSAEVVDGLIRLHVASPASPGMTYRIDIGVDFRQLGFSTARIQPVESQAKTPDPPMVSENRSPFWNHAVLVGVGPRKHPLTGTAGDSSHVDSRKQFWVTSVR